MDILLHYTPLWLNQFRTNKQLQFPFPPPILSTPVTRTSHNHLYLSLYFLLQPISFILTDLYLLVSQQPAKSQLQYQLICYHIHCRILVYHQLLFLPIDLKTYFAQYLPLDAPLPCPNTRFVMPVRLIHFHYQI